MPTRPPKDTPVPNGWGPAAGADSRIISIVPRLASPRADAFERVLEALSDVSRIDFGAYKPESTHRGIERRMKIAGCIDARAYVRLLGAEPAEAHRLTADLLIGTTRFFRDAEAFASLADDVFALLTRGRTARETLRVWVPGCSTGEEAYSIAMAYAEFCDDTGCDVPLHVVGTDIDAARIAAARRGIYRESAMDGVSAARRERFFIAGSGGRWSIAKELRDRCSFLQHDVLAAPALSGADLVSLRNVLIYLRADRRGEVLDKLHQALRAGGVLLLGSAETADGARERFELRDARTRTYVKAAAAPAASARTGHSEKGLGAQSRHALVSIIRQQNAAIADLQAANSALAHALQELDSVGHALDAAGRRMRAADAALRDVDDALYQVNALASDGAQMLALLDALPVAAVVLDSTLRVKHCTAAARRLLGHDALTARTTLAELAVTCDAPDLGTLVGDVARTGAERQCEVRLERPMLLKISRYALAPDERTLLLFEEDVERAGARR